MAATKLHQVLAIEKGIKTRATRKMSDAYKTIQKPDLFNGFAKTYLPKDEDGDRFPPERKRVQSVAGELLRETGKVLAELFDVTAQKDFANCDARADVILEGETEPLLRDAPVTFLLFLEKQLTDLHSFANRLPVLDPAEEWTFDANANIYKTERILTTKTKKVQRPIVLHPPTKEHPAQTQLITEDQIVGHWETLRHSSALPQPLKQDLLERIERLSKAVKVAREKANAVDAEKREVGRTLFRFLFDQP